MTTGVFSGTSPTDAKMWFAGRQTSPPLLAPEGSGEGTRPQALSLWPGPLPSPLPEAGEGTSPPANRILAPLELDPATSPLVTAVARHG
jgi:hypothetical protein